MSLRVLSVKSCAAIVLAATILISGAIAPAAGAASTATLPPGLVVLEQQMQQLQVNSDRFSMKVELGGEGAGARGGHAHRKQRTVSLLNGVGERSLAEEAGGTEVAVLKAKLLGAVSMEVRAVDGEAYLRSPGIARLDGGRPWVHMSKAEVSEQDDSFAAPTGPGEGAAGGMFSQLPKDFERAEAVTEVGPATVDGRQTTEFAAKLNMGKVLASLTVHEPRELHKALAKAKATLDVFFEPDGLPLRTNVAIDIKGVSIAVEVKILAVNVPVEVSAPPADETISAKRLKALERKLAKKALKDLGKGKHRKGKSKKS